MDSFPPCPSVRTPLHHAVPVTALSGLGIVLTHILAIPVFGDQPTAWQLAGTVLVIGASVLLALGRETVPAGIRPPS
jgi:multidrug transporter EmrE-like cation transporter